MNEQRRQEIITSMNAFTKDTYSKKELISEMFTLQKEMVQLTFEDEETPTDEYRIWDVEKHFRQMNRENGHIADEELNEFTEGAKEFCNLIKAEVSGYKGESKAFHELQNLEIPKKVLRNIELNDGQNRTELDLIVITSGNITIVEVKNYVTDHFIDSNGDCFKTGKYLRKECNLYQKMHLKEMLLRKILLANDITGFRVNSLVVFTNDTIEVHNCDTRIRICFPSQLCSTIRCLAKPVAMDGTSVKMVANVIKHAESKKEYLFDFDVNKFKNDYATVKVMLEEATTREICVEEEPVVSVKTRKNLNVKSILTSKTAKKIGSVLAFVGLPVLTYLWNENGKVVGKNE